MVHLVSRWRSYTNPQKNSISYIFGLIQDHVKCAVFMTLNINLQSFVRKKIIFVKVLI